MQEKDILQTKRKLAGVFTLSIFAIVFLLGVLVFTGRFLNEYHKEYTSFVRGSNALIQEVSRREDILDFLRLTGDRERIENFMERRGKQEHIQDKLVSYLIISDDGEVLERNLREQINLEVLLEEHDSEIYRSDGVYVRKSQIEWLLEDATIIFYKKAHYPIMNYLGDVLFFGFSAALFSVILYIVNFQFVTRIFRPVESNLKDMKDFIHNAGHELKTPIAVIRGNLQIMKREKKLDTDLVTDGISEVDRMNKLIEGLIELSDLGKTTTQEEVSLDTVVHHTIEELKGYAAQHDVELINTIDQTYILHTHKEELGMLLSNIVKNAIKYNIPGGKVEVGLDKDTLYITDTGIGISSEEQTKIFERFYQGEKARSSEGFGIGLSLVRKIVEMNEWKIEVTSVPGQGTTFKIHF